MKFGGGAILVTNSYLRNEKGDGVTFMTSSSLVRKGWSHFDTKVVVKVLVRGEFIFIYPLRYKNLYLIIL